MLPDLPKTKNLIRKGFNFYVKEAAKKYAQLPLSEDQYKIIHEGEAMLINYSEKESHQTPLKRVGSEFSVNIDDLIKNPEMFYDELDKMAKEIANQQGEMFFNTISDVTEKFGQVTKRPGDPTAETILEIYEKIRITFQPDGTPNLPTIFCGYDMIEKMKKATKEMFETEEYLKRFEKIINQKKQDWIDRENNRKLVD